ncbi:MAG: calcineurin-like phosphoesterase C-terminal domain-containing protein [Bacteroidales bacterium]|nr:calcineurin-like phosphoesterase C-terminal domain-containing protein [Bacteroidales bacterium]
MKILFTTVFTLLSLFIYSQNQEFAKGKVFSDINRNGKIDTNEKGIANILVSNQKDVVITDINGDYTIPVDNQTIIFITKPSDYSVPLDCNNVPQFYYIHQPDGSPDVEYEGIKPTGILPEFINFPLYKTDKKDAFSVLVFADVQVADQNELEYFREDVISNVLNNNHHVDFGLSLGDLVHDNVALFQDYKKSMALLGIPHYSVQGNHDVNYDAEEIYSSETFKKHFGPNYYSFDYGNVHFICLDNIERYCTKKSNTEWWNCYRGNIGHKQFLWLKNDLQHVPDNRLIVISQHIPFQELLNITDGRETVENQNELFELLKERENILILAGHRHTLQHCYFNKPDGWFGNKELHQIVCSSVSGSWWSGPKDENGIPLATQIDGVPNGYFIIEFQDNTYVHTYFQAGNSANQIRIESPKGVGEENGSRKIIVNVFNGNKYSNVIAAIDNSKTIDLSNEIMKDPYIDNQFQTYKKEYKSWISPSKSTQIWSGDIYSIEKGFHILKVTVIDEFDRKNNFFSVFEIK